MSRRLSASVGLVVGALFCGNACAMTSTSGSSAHCRVVDGGKLPAASGGATALCASIERALAARVPGRPIAVEVRAQSASRLSAVVTANGRALPPQNFARMDRDLDGPAFERFAQALADAVAKAVKN